MIAVRGFARIGLIIILLKGPYGLPTTFPPLPFLKSTCQHFYLPVFFAAPTLNHNDQTYDSASGEVEGIISPLSPKFPKCRVFTSANLTLLFFHPYIILNNVKENVDQKSLLCILSKTALYSDDLNRLITCMCLLPKIQFLPKKYLEFVTSYKHFCPFWSTDNVH